MKLEVLAGNGKKIGLLTLPFLTVGLILNILYPTYFQIGGPSKALYDTAIALSDKFYKEMNCDNAFKELTVHQNMQINQQCNLIFYCN